MDSSRKSSNKISDIVRLQQMLKKWKKLAKNGGGNTVTSAGTSSTTTAATHSASTASKSIKFLKRTLSFTDVVSASSSSCDAAAVPKGFLAVCVGKDLKRFVIKTEYLRHPAFGVLLQEAEEEFGFQQEGVLRIPCEVPVFEKILKAVEEKKKDVFHVDDEDAAVVGYCSSSSDCELTPSHHNVQMCR